MSEQLYRLERMGGGITAPFEKYTPVEPDYEAAREAAAVHVGDARRDIADEIVDAALKGYPDVE